MLSSDEKMSVSSRRSSNFSHNCVDSKVNGATSSSKSRIRLVFYRQRGENLIVLFYSTKSSVIRVTFSNRSLSAPRVFSNLSASSSPFQRELSSRWRPKSPIQSANDTSSKCDVRRCNRICRKSDWLEPRANSVITISSDS